jgi:glycosidase
VHNYLPEQPDLNWWQPMVHREFLQILQSWFDRGVAGFRIDVAHGLYKDAKLRDNPPLAGNNPVEGRFGLRPVYNANRPETHDVFRDWRTIADGYCPPRLLLGETWVPDPERMASYYGRDDELQLAFNFPFAFAEFGARAGLLRAHVSAHPRMTYRPESAIRSRPGWVGCRDGWVHKPPARSMVEPAAEVLFSRVGKAGDRQ